MMKLKFSLKGNKNSILETLVERETITIFIDFMSVFAEETQYLRDNQHG